MIDFFNNIIDFLSTGIYDVLKEFVAYILSNLLLGYLKFQLVALEFFWDVGGRMLDDLQVNDLLAGAFDMLPVDIKQMAYFFRLPESINLIVNAFMTKYVMRYVGL